MDMDAEEALNVILNDPRFAVEKRKFIERLDESRRQLDEGEYEEFDDEGLRALFRGPEGKERENKRAKTSISAARPPTSHSFLDCRLRRETEGSHYRHTTFRPRY